MLPHGVTLAGYVGIIFGVKDPRVDHYAQLSQTALRAEEDIERRKTGSLLAVCAEIVSERLNPQAESREQAIGVGSGFCSARENGRAKVAGTAAIVNGVHGSSLSFGLLRVEGQRKSNRDRQALRSSEARGKSPATPNEFGSQGL